MKEQIYNIFSYPIFLWNKRTLCLHSFKVTLSFIFKKTNAIKTKALHFKISSNKVLHNFFHKVIIRLVFKYFLLFIIQVQICSNYLVQVIDISELNQLERIYRMSIKTLYNLKNLLQWQLKRQISGNYYKMRRIYLSSFCLI